MRIICSVFYFFLFSTFIGLGQNLDTTENEMAVVYFFEMEDRPYIFGLVPLYDGQEPIGMLPWAHYIRYECPPGEHLFYSISDENKSFIEAEVLAGKVYIIEVYIRPGHVPSYFTTDRARMKPVDPTQKLFDIERYRKVVQKKRTKHFYWSSERANKSFLESAKKNKSDKYQRRLNKYYKKKKKEKIKVLHPNWYIESETILLEYIENDI